MSKAFLGLLGLYGVFLYATSFSMTKAYFVDSATSMNNTFIVANSFPSPSPTGTPTSTPTNTPTPTITPTPTPENIATHIVISEVQIAGNNIDNDFIELYNPTSSPISLDTYSLVKRTSGGSEASIYSAASFSATDIIPAHGFFLWANSANSFSVNISANISSVDTLSPDNSIALRIGTTTIDALAWGSSTNPLVEGTGFTPNPTASQSIERKAQSSSTAASMNGGVDANKGNGYDTNNNATDFVLRTVSQPQHSGSGTESL